MKNLHSILPLLALLFLFTGCQEPQPKIEPTIVEPKVEPIVEEPKVEPIIPPVVELNTTTEEKLIVENYIEDDLYTRVYKGCFKTGSTRLQRSCKKKINKFLQDLPLAQKRNIIIEVHTDKGGRSKNNLAISQKRALVVSSSLYHKEYKYSHVYYRGYGESRPLYDSTSKKATLENRRVVIFAKDKYAKIDKKQYRLYKQREKSSKKSKKRVEVEQIEESTLEETTPEELPVVAKIVAPNIKKYTGEADTGWIYFGNPKLKKKFTITCMEDRPREVRRRELRGHKDEEFIQKIHNRVYQGKIEDIRYKIAPVTIFEDGALPTLNPNIILTHQNQSRSLLTTIVNSYHGERGILYRVFINKKNSVKNNMECMDIMIPYTTGEVGYGVAYFREKGEIVAKELE